MREGTGNGPGSGRGNLTRAIMPRVWYHILMHDKLITIEDMQDFLEILQEESDELVALSQGCQSKSSMKSLMIDICQNAWHQAQIRAWINTVRQKVDVLSSMN
jgi:hypothetical protein